jgi:hypothetical protein
MTDNKFATLVKLRDIDKTVADPESDIRGRKVFDKNREPLGRIDALLVDDQEQKIRFFEVASGGFLGLGEAKSFIPVEAITKITEDEVHIDHTAETVAGAPGYDPALENQTHFYANTYGYYAPLWGIPHVYPNYLGRNSLERD